MSAAQVRNSYCLRFAAVTHLFTHVLPLPLPPDSPQAQAGECFWSGRPMRHETQVAVLHSLRLVARHLACVCLSIRPTRALDAARCVTFACIAAVADAVMRVAAFDFPSQVPRALNQLLVWIQLSHTGFPPFQRTE